MSRWLIKFGPEADKDLEKLSNTTKERTIEKLEWLQNNFDKITPAALGHDLHGFFKIRIGDWRIIYKINWPENKIIVIAIKHRSKIYKQRLK